MKKTLFLFFLLFSVTLNIKSQSLLDIFKLDVPIDSISKCSCKEEIKIVVSSANLVDGFKCKIRGFDFLVGVKNEKVIYYSTRDSGFLIKGFKYLTQNKIIIDSLKNDSIVYDPGSGAYIKLVEGWNLGFDWKDVYYEKSKMILRADAIPSVLFKRSNYYNSSTKWTRETKGNRKTKGN